MKPIKGMKRNNIWNPSRRVWFQKNDDGISAERSQRLKEYSESDDYERSYLGEPEVPRGEKAWTKAELKRARGED